MWRKILGTAWKVKQWNEECQANLEMPGFDDCDTTANLVMDFPLLKVKFLYGWPLGGVHLLLGFR